MSLAIVLENERGNPVTEVIDSHNTLLKIIKMSDYAKTSCLRFIDPYGDTVFNYLQAGELSRELSELHQFATSQEEKSKLDEIKNLVQQCKDGRHLYVKIYGD